MENTKVQIELPYFRHQTQGVNSIQNQYINFRDYC